MNTQVHYGIGSTSSAQDDWSLVTSHAMTLSGLSPGTTYEVQAESSYYSNPDLFGPVQNITLPGSRLFPNASAAWLYSAPAGSGSDITSVTSSMGFAVNAHDGGFDYPVVYTDGSHGCTNVVDSPSYGDSYCVPNPAGGYFPSVGGCGANDGHLVVVDTSTGDYFDFWRLYTNGSGVPTNSQVNGAYDVGAIFEGSLNGNGAPGTTAAAISGAAGAIMPGELDCGTCLNHAVLVTVPWWLNSDQFGNTQSPAEKTDGKSIADGGCGSIAGNVIFEEGAEIQFDPSIDVSTLPNISTAGQALLRALQLYGGVLVDQGGNSSHSCGQLGGGFGFYSSLATTPDLGSGMSSEAGAHLKIYY